MSVFLQPIYTQTVGSGGAASITFNNIPQTFTDLLIVSSARAVNSGLSSFLVIYNADTTTSYSYTVAAGSGSSAFSFASANNNYMAIGVIGGSDYTANTFSSVNGYIPNYTSANYKSVVSESVAETNAAAIQMRLTASLYRKTAAITSVTLQTDNGNFAQYSTFSLYGVLRQGI